MRFTTTFALGVSLLAGALSAQAQHRELGAHEHGRGTLNIAVEGNRISMELEVPGADIVGFEHVAKTRQQKAAMEKAQKQLLAPQSLFKFSNSAQCTVNSANVELEDGGHDGDKKAEEKAGEEHSHSEFHAQYTFDCRAPASLTAIEFDYFRAFAGAQRLDVNVITPERPEQVRSQPQ